jgi:hypothetical protein
VLIVFDKWQEYQISIIKSWPLVTECILLRKLQLKGYMVERSGDRAERSPRLEAAFDASFADTQQKNVFPAQSSSQFSI